MDMLRECGLIEVEGFLQVSNMVFVKLYLCASDTAEMKSFVLDGAPPN